MFLRECSIYAFEVLLPKATKIWPRTELGVHLAYENRIRGDTLTIHLERNLSSHGADRNTLQKLYYQIEDDFRLLAVRLLNDPSFQQIQQIEGVTNFQAKTGKRYGFASEIIIKNQLLCDLFDARIEKPRLSGLESGPPIRRFIISREQFLTNFSPNSPRIFEQSEAEGMYLNE